MKIAKKRRGAVIKQFRDKVVNIFGANLNFAFICGSFARGDYTKKHDIDMFICLKRTKNVRKATFHKWYVKFNLINGFRPDPNFGEEIINYTELLKKINKAINRPMLMIKNRDIYDGIVWSGMLSGKVVGFCGDRILFNKTRKGAINVCKKWISSLSPFKISESHIDIELKNLIIYKNEQ